MGHRRLRPRNIGLRPWPRARWFACCSRSGSTRRGPGSYCVRKTRRAINEHAGGLGPPSTSMPPARQ
eukprot:7271310-Alexandrium_andersonii.AAC.1